MIGALTHIELVPETALGRLYEPELEYQIARLLRTLGYCTPYLLPPASLY